MAKSQSIREKVAAELKVSRSSLQRIVKRDLSLSSFKKRKVHYLSEVMKEKRLKRSKGLIDRFAIQDKIKSIRKTGGGLADAEFTALEEKIYSIRGTECFEGIGCGIDVSAEPQSSQLSAEEMSISPSFPFDGKVPLAGSRKRQHSQLATSIDDDTKRILIAKEDEKLVLLREIKENLVSIGNVLQLLPEMVQDQKQ
ncbi:hypothetical protein LOD99_11122 [Oopsacas minuta]|uniref:Uncharacterized protein n=1 Tax=Oopsacas minuta TaxID=111878 RepID=A0AAV7KBS5_9METZ|nr:hypothetical protein LOD99_11122 [Oopsacas minuta]